MQFRTLLALSVALVACNTAEKTATGTTKAPAKAKTAAAPPQKASVPPRPSQAGDKVHPSSQPTSQPTGLPAGHPPTGQPPAGGAQPASQPTSQPTSQPAGAPGAVAGIIELDPGLIDSVKPGSSLYIMVRQAGARMPLAAKRIPVGEGAKMFPFKFLVTPADVMMKGTVLTGQVTVDARIDQDGDAISKQPGDITGQTPAPVTVGDKDVKFTLDKKL